MPIALDMAGKIIVALLIFWIGKIIAKKISTITEKIMVRAKFDDTLVHFLGNVIFGILMMLVIMASLNKLGVNTTSFVAIIGGASVAVGLALKNELSNFAAGVLIILFRPFNKGDYVKIGEHEGNVSKIALINTSLMTINNHEVIIPNSKITADSMINYDSLANRRTDIIVGISYNADIKTAKNLMLKVANEHKLVFADPEPTVIVKELNSSSVDLALRIWSVNSDWRQVTSDLRENIKYIFDDNNIEIPFPQQVVHINQS
ncbi:MAG: mechanosensitive ion channel [Moraxellaceae bacterium]|nr:mechanosensitive ion channel [Moraxellaceae bacterium]